MIHTVHMYNNIIGTQCHACLYNYRFSLTFSTVDRTVCPIRYTKMLEEPNPPPLFYIDVFTSSVDPQPYSLMIEPVENFILEYASSIINNCIMATAK